MKQKRFIRVLQLGDSTIFAVDSTFIQHEEEVLLFESCGLKGKIKADDCSEKNKNCLATRLVANQIIKSLAGCCKKHTSLTAHSEAFVVISDKWIKKFTFTSKKGLPRPGEPSYENIEAIADDYIDNTEALIRNALSSDDTHFEGDFVSLIVKTDEQKNTCPIPSTVIAHVIEARKKQEKAEKASASELQAAMDKLGMPADVQQAISKLTKGIPIDGIQIFGIGSINPGSSCEEKEPSTKNRRDYKTEEKNDG